MTRTCIPSWPVFAQYPDDWRGRTVEVWADGKVTLDSGLFSKEWKAQGATPARTLLITPTISGGEIMDWIEQVKEKL